MSDALSLPNLQVEVRDVAGNLISDAPVQVTITITAVQVAHPSASTDTAQEH